MSEGNPKAIMTLHQGCGITFRYNPHDILKDNFSAIVTESLFRHVLGEVRRRGWEFVFIPRADQFDIVLTDRWMSSIGNLIYELRKDYRKARGLPEILE